MPLCHNRCVRFFIFDRTPNGSWSDKIYRRQETAGMPPLTVWGDVMIECARCMVKRGCRRMGK